MPRDPRLRDDYDIRLVHEQKVFDVASKVGASSSPTIPAYDLHLGYQGNFCWCYYETYPSLGIFGFSSSLSIPLPGGLLLRCRGVVEGQEQELCARTCIFLAFHGNDQPY